MNSRVSTEYVSIESRRDHELPIVIQSSIQFLILFGRHYGRNAQAQPPSCPIFLPMSISLATVEPDGGTEGLMCVDEVFITFQHLQLGANLSHGLLYM